MNRTNRNADENRRTDREQTMGDVSQTHPYGDHASVNRPFERGPIVVADGGERRGDDGREEGEEYDAREEDDDETEQMKDVDHTPPHGEGANRVFERGGKEEPVESEE